ncbi:type I secretion outer membrane protein, TolC family [Serratia fonticola]|uniref:Type I secretion outer membrane protein, TolC family n=1 Tax=Serratia fonticola TaxID=47917 RepID=A0A4V6KQD0_SERFO|nr:type I secretion outer membrane protein, TolC family [Serratia fonticola]
MLQKKPQINWVVTKSTGKDDFGREDPWQTMVTVSWPVFRGGSATAAREAALLRAEAELEVKEKQQMDLEFEARAAVQDANTLLTRANLYVNLIEETAKVKAAFFDQWYHLGRRTLLDVLIAESDYNNNRVNEVSYRFDSYLAVLKAYGSTGMLSRWLLDDMNNFER